MSRFPPPPDGVSLDDLRRGNVTYGPHDGTQERFRKRTRFREALPTWVSQGGRCDLLDEKVMGSSPVSSLSAGLQALALGRHADWSDPAPSTVPPGETMYSPSEKGYCYLSAVRSDTWNRAADALGYNPWRPAVEAWLLDNPSVHSGRRFRVTLGGARTGGGSHVQMHMVASDEPGALDWRDALACGPANTRVGSDLRDGVTLDEKGPTGGGQMSVGTPAPQQIVRVPFHVMIKHTEGRCTFNPRTSVGVKKLTDFFESAQLVDFGCTVAISGSKDSLVAVGFSTGASAPASTEEFLALPTSAILSGTDNGSVTEEFRLPPNHSFGTEFKAVAVGNPNPVLHIRVDGGNPTIALVRGSVSLRLTGVGVPASILLSTSK